MRYLLAATFLVGFPAHSDGGDASSGIGLALGSGGAGGLAHIAMLESFDERGIKPDAIAGASIGAIVGAMYAAGLSADEIRKKFVEFGERDKK